MQFGMWTRQNLPLAIVVTTVSAVSLENIVVSGSRVGDGTEDVVELRCRCSDDCGSQGEKGDGDEGRGSHVGGVYDIINKLRCLEVDIREVEQVRWYVESRGLTDRLSVLI